MTGERASDTVHLRVSTCEAILFEGEVAWVELPLSDGLIGIWPDHAPLVAEVTAGTLRYSQVGAVVELPVTAGALHVNDEGCSVLLSPLHDDPGQTDAYERLYAVLEAAVIDLWREERRIDLFGEQLGDDELDSVAADRSGE